MPTHGVQRQTDKRNVAFGMFGLEHAAFGADADERNRSVEHDLRRSQVHDLARSRAGFHHGVDRVACFLVQLVEFARRKNDVADEFDRETARVDRRDRLGYA